MVVTHDYERKIAALIVLKLFNIRAVIIIRPRTLHDPKWNKRQKRIDHHSKK